GRAEGGDACGIIQEWGIIQEAGCEEGQRQSKGIGSEGRGAEGCVHAGACERIGELMRLPIYLDCNATTPVDPRGFAAMAPYFTEVFGNAASTGHAFGAQALNAVQTARNTIARAINARPEEIVFTSGATESDNLAIKGAARQRGRGHIVTAATEHKA